MNLYDSAVLARRFLLVTFAGLLIFPLAGCIVVPAVTTLVGQELVTAVTTRLEEAVYQALEKLAAEGGIEQNPQVHIALPPGMRLIVPVLKIAGLGPELVKLEHDINQTAEQVAGVAYPVYSQVIEAHQWAKEIDAVRIEWAAPSETLRKMARQELVDKLLPLVQEQAQKTGLDETWRELEAARLVLNDLKGISLGDVHAYIAEQLIDAVVSTIKEGAPMRPPEQAQSS